MPDVGHNLAFIGFVQPASGGTITMSETQARWWAELCKGNVILPSIEEMRSNIDTDRVRNKVHVYVQREMLHSIWTIEI